MDLIEEFFSRMSLIKQTNHTIIELVPKATHSPNVGDYRQIGGCNVFYKVITRLLLLVWGPILDTIVDQEQAAFVNGCSMIENIYLAQEFLRQYNRKRFAPRCIFKFDLRKAYDSTNWDFLRSILEGLGFLRRFID